MVVPSARIGETINDLEPEIIAWRRQFHRSPELSFREYATAGLIREGLAAVGFTVTSPTKTSVVGTLSTGKPGPVVALRADIDGIAVQERTGLSFASQADGVMHACGHDGHVAVLLGVAHALDRLRGELSGEFRLVFQHAEEQVPSGAPELIDAGVLDGADVVLGQHLWAPLAAGLVSVRPGPIMASTDYFTITVTGTGGHAGLPHETTDPVAVAAQIVTNLNHLVARETNPLHSLVVSVTCIHAGQVPNVIPETATITGTMRTLDDKLREDAPKRIEQIAQGIAIAHRAEAATEFTFGPPPVRNDEALCAMASKAVRRQLGEQALTSIDPVMGGDDFACFAERVSGVYLLVGAGRPDADNAPHHHPEFTLDERSLANAAKVLTDTALLLSDGTGYGGKEKT